MKRIGLLLLFFSISFPVRAQDLGKPVQLNSLVGDTLWPMLRQHYGLLSNVDKFVCARFFVSNDSIVNACVRYMRKDGTPEDTLVQQVGIQHVVVAMMNRKDSLLESTQLLLKDGLIVSGKILRETTDSLTFAAGSLGNVAIAKANIENISERTRGPARKYSDLVKDPNMTRAYLMPTASTLPAGTGYIGDYELIFFTAAYGLTDWLMINGGTVLLPLRPEDMIFDYGAKVRLLPAASRLNFSLGVQMFGGGLIENVSGIAYGVASVGNRDRALNFAVGDAFSGSGSQILFGISGDERVGESIKLMAEFWTMKDANWSPLVIGLRFFGSKLSGDIGLLYPLGQSWDSLIGIPVVSITYSF